MALKRPLADYEAVSSQMMSVAKFSFWVGSHMIDAMQHNCCTEQIYSSALSHYLRGVPFLKVRRGWSILMI